MSDQNPTREEVRKSIVPKSNQLNTDDLLTGPITVTITGVGRGDKDQPIDVHVDCGHQPYKPCKSMRRVLIAVFTDDPKAWIGQQMTLFADPSVMWAGVKVGGIRISHLSGLKKDREFMLTKTRGKKASFTVHPIKQATKAVEAQPEKPPGKPPEISEAQFQCLKAAWQSGPGKEVQKAELKAAFGLWVKGIIGDHEFSAMAWQQWPAAEFDKCMATFD